MCFLTWSLVTFCRTRLSVLMMIPESGSGKRRAPCEKKKGIGDCNLHSILRIRHACEEGKLSAEEEEEEGGGNVSLPLSSSFSYGNRLHVSSTKSALRFLV